MIKFSNQAWATTVVKILFRFLIISRCLRCRKKITYWWRESERCIYVMKIIWYLTQTLTIIKEFTFEQQVSIRICKEFTNETSVAKKNRFFDQIVCCFNWKKNRNKKITLYKLDKSAYWICKLCMELISAKEHR